MEADNTVSYEMAKHKTVWEVLKQWASAHPSLLVPARAHRAANHGNQHTQNNRSEAYRNSGQVSHWI